MFGTRDSREHVITLPNLCDSIVLSQAYVCDCHYQNEVVPTLRVTNVLTFERLPAFAKCRLIWLTYRNKKAAYNLQLVEVA